MVFVDIVWGLYGVCNVCIEFVLILYSLYGVCMVFVDIVWGLYGVCNFAAKFLHRVCVVFEGDSLKQKTTS